MLHGSALSPSVLAGFSTRTGGTSAPPYDSLNLAGNVGDDPAAVRANVELLAAQIGVAATQLHWAEQVHGADVAVVDDPAGPPNGHQGVDALVTSVRGAVLCIRVADCMPVLFADVDAGVVGAAHAGRKGLVAGVLTATVAAMEQLGASRAGIVAEIGPSICGPCYEVPPEMAADVAALVPQTRRSEAANRLDLPAGASAQLKDLGITSISVSAACTVEQPERWFSYRRDGRTGRFAGFVGLT